MKTLLKFVVVVLVALTIVAPVSAKTAGPSAGVAGPEVAPNLVDWYENWDSYPTGQNMHGIGGWKGWGNAPGATAYTSDVQRISLPNSIDINGGSDLVHEYAIDSGVWAIQPRSTSRPLLAVRPTSSCSTSMTIQAIP